MCKQREEQVSNRQRIPSPMKTGNLRLPLFGRKLSTRAVPSMEEVNTVNVISKRSKPVKRVRFNVDCEDRIQSESYSYKKPSKSYNKDLYWSEREKGVFRYNAEVHGISLAEVCSETAKEISLVWDNCTNKEMSHQELKDDLKIIFKWVDTTGRGLETRIVKKYKQRVQAVNKILNCHAYLKANPTMANNADEYLRKCSLSVSMPFREFAYMMAMGDAFVAVSATTSNQQQQFC